MCEPTVIWREGCTGVFWDLEDYPFPDGVDPVSIYKQIKRKLKDKGFHGKLSIRAYVAADGFSEELVETYRDAGILVERFPAGDCKTSRIWLMLVDILSWSFENYDEPVNLILLSKNVADGEEEEVGASSLDVLEGLFSPYDCVVLSDPQPDWQVASDSSQWLLFE